MILNFYLTKVNIYIPSFKIDWNHQLYPYLAGQTKSNYLIFNINKLMFFSKRTLLFYKLLGLNNGSFIIYYLENLNNYINLLEGLFINNRKIPHSYPFICAIIKPKVLSNWKTNYKKCNSFYILFLINCITSFQYNLSRNEIY